MRNANCCVASAGARSLAIFIQLVFHGTQGDEDVKGNI